MDRIVNWASQLNNKRGYLSVFLAVNGSFLLLSLLLFFLNLWIIPVVAYMVSLFLITVVLLWYSRGKCCPCVEPDASDEPRMCTTPKNLREGGEGDVPDDLKLRMRAWRDERSACIIDMTPIPLLSDESPCPQRRPSTSLVPVHSSSETFLTASSVFTEGGSARSPPPTALSRPPSRQSGGKDSQVSSPSRERGLPTVSEYVEKHCEDHWRPQSPCDRIPSLSDAEPSASTSGHRRFPWRLNRPAFRHPAFSSDVARKTSSTTTTADTTTPSSSSSSSDAPYNVARRAMGRVRHALRFKSTSRAAESVDGSDKLKPEAGSTNFNSRILMEEEDLFRIPFYQYKT